MSDYHFNTVVTYPELYEGLADILARHDKTVTEMMENGWRLSTSSTQMVEIKEQYGPVMRMAFIQHFTKYTGQPVEIMGTTLC